MENNNIIKITEVDFNMGGDGRNALYLNGQKIKEGDYYHDKITVFIEGFVFALKTMGINYNYQKMIASEDNDVAFGIYENFDAIPDKLQEFDKPTKK